MNIKIKDKNIYYELIKPYKLEAGFIKYIEYGLEQGLHYGVLRSKRTKQRVGFWRIYSLSKNYMDQLYFNNYW